MTSPGDTNGNGLLLYYHYRSYYSQKVVLALHEKKLKFKSQIVQLTSFEQYKPQFMRLNPKGQIPVLADGVKVIPDSARIIDYLEDNFSNGKTPRLWPHKGAPEFAQVQHFREVLDTLPIETITYGCLKCPELTKDMKISSRLRKELVEANAKKATVLETNALRYPELAEHYNRKRNRCWQQDTEKQTSEAVLKHLNDLEVLLDEIEARLALNVGEQSEWWLCSERFSVADISLAVLLHRLDQLGLSCRFWRLEKVRPNLDAYNQRLPERDSFQKTFVQTPDQPLPLMRRALSVIYPIVPNLTGAALLVATACLIGAFINKFRK